MSLREECMMIEQNDQIVCVGKHSDQKVLLVMLDNNQNNEKRLQCDICIEQKKGDLNAITFDEAKSRIEKQLNKHLNGLNVLLKQQLQYIDDFLKTIKLLHQGIEKSIKEIEEIINQWKQRLYKFNNENYTFSFIKELSNLDKQEHLWELEKKQHFHYQTHLITLEYNINLKFIIREIQQQIQNIEKEEQRLYQNIKKSYWHEIQIYPHEQMQIQLEHQQFSQGFCSKVFNELVQEIQQQELCYAIAFNKNDTIMAAGCNDYIKIWKLQNGQFIDSQIKLKGKSEVDIAICITFSKRINFFIYGSYDHSIGIWNEIQTDKWMQYSIANDICHQGIVTCIFLNQNENQVISGSEDKSLIIWKIINGTSIEFDQQLIKHTNTILSINMNQSETEIVSMSKDQQIIIWGKTKQGWKQIQVIKQSDIHCGHVVTFIFNYTLMIFQNFQKTIYTREKVQNHFTKQSQQNLELNQIVEVDEQQYFLFPNIYFIHKNIIVQRYDGHIYFVVFNQDFQLQSLSKLKISQKNLFYGNVTKNGKYLVVWSYEEQKFKIYMLKYL